MASDAPTGFFQRLRAAFSRGGETLGAGLGAILGGRKIDAAALEELETRLLQADCGMAVTEELIEGLRKRVARQQLGDVEALLAALREDITALLTPVAQPLVVDRAHKPYTILVVGVNGSGKTTTIGKLAQRYGAEGLKVVLAAGDTFRAAAVEQIGIWATRTGAQLVSQAAGADPAAVAFDAVQAAIERLLPAMPRRDVIRASLEGRGALILTRDMAEACALSNRIAPEHLEISAREPGRWEPLLRHAGAIFLGAWTSESLGDYCAGPNHVLPTSGTARFSSPLGVYDFQKRSSLIEVSEQGAQTLGRSASVLAHGEGLQAHARAAELRLK